MTTTQLIGTPVETSPYLELLQRRYAGDPGIELAIYSKLVAVPKKMKASPSLEKMALVTDLRAADIPALGTGAMDTQIPVAGLRVFDDVGRFLFFGAAGARDSIMFEKTSLFYTNTNLAEGIPDAPDVADFAVFSKGGRFFFLVSSDAPQEVKVWSWSSDDVEDPRGQWNPGESLAIGATVTKLWVTPGNTYLVVQTSTEFVRFKIEEELAPLAAVTGRLIGVSDSEDVWFRETGGDVIVCELDGDSYLTLDTLPVSAGVELSAAVSPDGAVVIVTGRPSSGTESPRFYAKTAGGDYVYTRGVARASSSSIQHRAVAIRDDDQIAIATADSSGSVVELYERDTITPDPFTPDGLLLSAGVGSSSDCATSRDGVFGATGSSVIHWDGTAYVTVTPSGYAAGRGKSLSSTGEFLMAATSAAVFAYRWDGTSFASIASPLSPSTIVRAVALSHSGLICAVVLATGTTGTLRIFQYTVSTNSWAQIGGDIAFSNSGSGTIGRAEFAPGRDDLLCICMQGSAPLIYKLTGGVFEAQAALPVPSGFTYGLAFAWSPDSNYLSCAVRNAALNWRLAVFFRGLDDGMTLAYQSDNLTNSNIANQLAYAPDGRYLVWGHGNSAVTAFVWSVSGATYTLESLPSLPTLAINGILFMAEDLALVGANTTPKWAYDMSGTLQTYAVSHTFALATGALSSFLTYNPAKTILHYGRNGDAHHVSPDAPYAETTSLSFALGTPPASVYNVVYSPSGRDVVFDTPTGPQVAFRPNTGSDFLNSKDIEGVFVFVYELDGTIFVERGFSQHKFGSSVRDLGFSPNEQVFSYHVSLPEDAPIDSAKGRLIYNIVDPADPMLFRGQIWEEEMTDSLLAYSPWNTHFVVTHEHLNTNDPFISLHTFDGTYAFTTDDTKPVAFGPPDFSKCDDVVVAHGGIPQMTFFKHDPDNAILIPRPVTLNWGYEGVILDVAFSDDCGDLLVLTPDELIPIEDDKDDDVLTPDEPTALDEPIDPDVEDPHIDVDPDGDVLVDPGVIDPTYPGEYHWDPHDPDLYGINYVPYSVVTVTFRTRSIPS